MSCCTSTTPNLIKSPHIDARELFDFTKLFPQQDGWELTSVVSVDITPGGGLTVTYSEINDDPVVFDESCTVPAKHGVFVLLTGGEHGEQYIIRITATCSDGNDSYTVEFVDGICIDDGTSRIQPCNPVPQSALEQAAAGPKSTSIDGESVTEHSLRDHIELDRYLSEKAAAARKRPPIRLTKLIPGGTT